MTNRQKELLRVLIYEFEKDNTKYVSKEEIQQACFDEDDMYFYIIKPSSRKGDSYRIEITKDCDTINRMNEEECSYIIISNSTGYKIATADELVEWAERQKRAIQKKCIKRNNMLRKYKLNGQMNLENVEIKPFI